MLTGRLAEAMGAAQRARAIADVAGLEPASGIARDPAMVALFSSTAVVTTPVRSSSRSPLSRTRRQAE